MFTFTNKLRRPSVALIVSFVALFASLGGGAYAAFKLPNNSVGTKQLKNKAVTNAKLAPNSVGTANIKNGAVTASKINTSGLTVPSDQTASNFAQGSPNQGITATAATIGSPIQITTTGTKRVDRVSRGACSQWGAGHRGLSRLSHQDRRECGCQRHRLRLPGRRVHHR